MKESLRASVKGLHVGENRLESRVVHHLVHVLRLREGAGFIAFDPVTGAEGDATLGTLGGDDLYAHVGPLREAERRLRTHVTLLQGIAKADKCDAIVRDATELGATDIVLVATARSIVKLDAGRQKERLARLSRIAEEAARQCRRGAPPMVTFMGSWAEALSSIDEACARFCLYEESRLPVGPLLQKALSEGIRIAFAVGPEGGLERSEVALAEQLGWAVTSLGPLILRTETVAAAFLGAVTVWGSLDQERPV